MYIHKKQLVEFMYKTWIKLVEIMNKPWIKLVEIMNKPWKIDRNYEQTLIKVGGNYV